MCCAEGPHDIFRLRGETSGRRDWRVGCVSADGAVVYPLDRPQPIVVSCAGYGCQLTGDHLKTLNGWMWPNSD
jgi:hypothetical protein